MNSRRVMIIGRLIDSPNVWLRATHRSLVSRRELIIAEPLSPPRAKNSPLLCHSGVTL